MASDNAMDQRRRTALRSNTTRYVCLSGLALSLLVIVGCMMTRTVPVLRPEAARMQILLPPQPSAGQELAAEELATHLHLVTGHDPPIRAESAAVADCYTFRFAGAQGPGPALRPGEGRYWIQADVTHFYGADPAANAAPRSGRQLYGRLTVNGAPVPYRPGSLLGLADARRTAKGPSM